MDKGYFDCSCDDTIAACLARVSVPAGFTYNEQRLFKGAAMMYFQNSLCRSDGQWVLEHAFQKLGRKL